MNSPTHLFYLLYFFAVWVAWSGCSATLLKWLPKVRELASKTRQLHALFNNNYEDKAVRNASQMRLMLD